MRGYITAVYVIIWIFVTIAIIAKSIGKSKKDNYRGAPPQAQNEQQTAMRQVQSSTPSSAPAGSKPTFRSVPGSTYGTTRNVPGQNSTTAQRHSGYGQGVFAASNSAGKMRSSSHKDTASSSMLGAKQAGSLGENRVLLEDRRNDWLARQLREEAAIKRRGSVYDLGASHDTSCDAEKTRLFHTARHNTNGLNRQMFK